MICIVPVLLQAQNGDPDWHNEGEVLGRELTERHPDLFFRMDSTAFFSALEQRSAACPGKGKMTIALELQQVVARLGDPNTRVNYHFFIGRKDILPMRLFWFSEGLVVLRCEADSQGLEGRRIVAVNGHPLEQVADSLATLVADPTPSRIMSELPLMLTWIPVLEHFGFAQAGVVEVEAEDPSGHRARYLLTPSPNTEEMTGLDLERLPVSWENKREYFHSKYLEDDRIYYIQYNKCWSREMEETYGSGATALFMPSYREFEKAVLADLRKLDINKLVLDLRNNDGGKAEQGSRLVERLERSGISKKADSYLIIGRDTRDEALVNALEFREAFGAEVLGEASGGRPNYFGDPRQFVLTASGLVVSCPEARISLLEGDPEAMLPDLEVNESFEAYLQGLDPALESIASMPVNAD